VKTILSLMKMTMMSSWTTVKTIRSMMMSPTTFQLTMT